LTREKTRRAERTDPQKGDLLEEGGELKPFVGQNDTGRKGEGKIRKKKKRRGRKTEAILVAPGDSKKKARGYFQPGLRRKG